MYEYCMFAKLSHLGYPHKVEMGMLYSVRLRRRFIRIMLRVSTPLTFPTFSEVLTNTYQLGSRDLYPR
jgi:hypothetical protein